jgi:hypothetical protein
MSTQFSELEKFVFVSISKCQIGTEDNSKNHNRDQIFFLRVETSFIYLCVEPKLELRYMFFL